MLLYFQLGLWNGDVVLTNFTLKQQLISFGGGIGIGLEYGKVGNCRIKVPWTQLQSGEVEVTAQDVEVVLRLHVDDEASLREPIMAEDSKMVRINASVFFVYL